LIRSSPYSIAINLYALFFRANTDILFGQICGMQTLLVLTGVTSVKDAEEYENSADPQIRKWAPHLYTQSVTTFSSLIKKHMLNAKELQ